MLLRPLLMIALCVVGGPVLAAGPAADRMDPPVGLFDEERCFLPEPGAGVANDPSELRPCVETDLSVFVAQMGGKFGMAGAPGAIPGLDGFALPGMAVPAAVAAFLPDSGYIGGVPGRSGGGGAGGTGGSDLRDLAQLGGLIGDMADDACLFGCGPDETRITGVLPSPAVIPLPATAPLLGLALALVAGFAVRRPRVA